MELFSLAIGAAIGGATGKFVEKFCDLGVQWLRERFRAHSREVQKRAH